MRLRMRGALDLGIDRGLWLLRVLHFSAIGRRRSLTLHRRRDRGIGAGAGSGRQGRCLRRGGGGRYLRLATDCAIDRTVRSEEHTSELQSLMRISYAVFCLKKKTTQTD